MSFNYVGNLNALVSCLENANTTTAAVGGTDLSGSMSTRIQTILDDVPEIAGARLDKFPALFVSIGNSTDAESAIAGGLNSRRKSKVVGYQIVGVYRRQGWAQGHAEALTDFYQMASNLEGVLKRNLTLSSTALIVRDVSTEFRTERQEQAWNKVFKTTFEVQYEYQ
jgi:hypothetical protein